MIISPVPQPPAPLPGATFPIELVASNPSGAGPDAVASPPNWFQFNYTTGALWGCINGEWTQLNTGGGGTPAGADTQIQFNNAGAFGASAALAWSDAFTDAGGLLVTRAHVGDFPSYQDFYGTQIVVSDTSTGVTAGDIYASLILAELNGSGDYTGDGDGVTGLQSRTRTRGTVHASYANGGILRVDIYDSTVVNKIIGGTLLAYTNDSSTAIDILGADIGAGASSGTVTNAYGVKVRDIIGATNNWAIKTGLGTNYFGDVVIVHRNTAPADGDLAAGDLAFWLDDTDGAAKAMFKAKSANGTVVTGNVALA